MRKRKPLPKKQKEGKKMDYKDSNLLFPKKGKK